jgi:hypothetical protein
VTKIARSIRSFGVPVHPVGVDCSSVTVRFLSDRLRIHHRSIVSRWRRLACGCQGGRGEFLLRLVSRVGYA